MDMVNDHLSVMRKQPAFASQADRTPEVLTATKQSARRLEGTGLAQTAPGPNARIVPSSTLDGRWAMTEGA